MKKQFTILSMLLVLFATSKAQYFNYLASNASVNVAGTYTDLGTSGTKITTNFSGAPMGNIDDNSSVQQIGFSFNFSGINFTEFVLNTNGFIRLGNRPTAISASHDVLFSTDTTATNVIYPFNINLQPTGNTEFRVFTTGTAGSKTCTIQFKALTDSGCPVNCNPAADIQYDNVDFQIILREGSNNIEFVYGNFIANGNLSGFVPTNCGLKLNDASRSINATKASTTAYASTAFLNGAYTGNRFNTRNSILPSSGFTIQFIPVPVLNNNVTVQTLYSMGKVPKNFDQSVSVIVQNVGTTNFTNFPVTLSVSGANTFNNTQTIANFPAGSKQTITFPAYNPSNTGTNSIIVSVPADDDTANDYKLLSQTVTNTTLGYAYTTTPDGNLGQTTSSIDLGIRFRVAGANTVSSITTYFTTAAKNYSVKIFTIDADTPKTQIYNSGTKVSVVGANVLTLPTPRAVTGDFFVVVTQPSTSASYTYAFEREDPCRAKTFYGRTPASTGTWFDFSVNPSNTFRLMIDVTMGSAVVPIKLSSFTGNKMGKNNQLNWVTTTEINNLGFEIQRSNDGKEFKKIGFIESKGNQSTVLNYTFSDALPLNGINYYRLRQIDKDNKETFSEIISIRNNEVETIEVISLYPNPTKGNIGIAFNSISNDKYVLQIIDITGKIVSKQYIDAQQGRNNLQMNTSFLNSGNYVVKILGNNNEEFASTVFIKQ